MEKMYFPLKVLSNDFIVSFGVTDDNFYNILLQNEIIDLLNYQSIFLKKIYNKKVVV